MQVDGNGKVELLWKLLMIAAAAMVSYFTAQGAMNQRMTVVETQGVERWNYVKSSLERIERNQDADRSEIRRIVQDWRDGVNRRTGEPLPLQRSIDERGQ